jgi:hypothetical protein
MQAQIISFTALWMAIVIHLSCNMQILGHHVKRGLGKEINGGKQNAFAIF